MKDQLDPTHLRRTLQRRGQVATSTAITSVVVTVAAVFAEAELEVPQGFVSSGGGRRGIHSPHLGFILAEMQVLARQHPGATW